MVRLMSELVDAQKTYDKTWGEHKACFWLNNPSTVKAVVIADRLLTYFNELNEIFVKKEQEERKGKGKGKS